MKNLYLITTQGLKDYYVLAADPTAACNALKRILNHRDYGFFCYREVTNIKCLATDAFESMRHADLDNSHHGVIIDADDVEEYIMHHPTKAEAGPQKEKSLTLSEWMYTNNVNNDQELKVYVEGYTLDCPGCECFEVSIRPTNEGYELIFEDGYPMKDLKYYGNWVVYDVSDQRPFIYASIDWLINNPDGPEKKEEDIETMIKQDRLEIIKKHAEEK